MKNIAALLAFLCVINDGYSQISFQKAFGYNELGFNGSAIQTYDGGYVLSDGNNLIKTNANGDTLWSKIYSIDSKLPFVNYLDQTKDGGFALTGLLGESAGGKIFLLKTDSTGNPIFSKIYFGGNVGSEANSVMQISNGGYIIAGNSNNSSGNDAAILIKTDLNGDTIWTKYFWIGEVRGASFNSAKETKDGGYVMAGAAYVGITYSDSPHYNIFVVKTDSNGNMKWAKTFGNYFKNYLMNSFANDIQETNDSGFIIIGETNEFEGLNNYNDVYLIKIDSKGDLAWSETFGDLSNEYGTSILKSQDGGYMVLGRSDLYDTLLTSSITLSKIDSKGNLAWTKKYSGGANQYIGHSLQQTEDGGYVIGASLIYYKQIGPSGILLIKVDSNGNSSCNESSYNFTVNKLNTVERNFPTYFSSGSNIGTPIVSFEKFPLVINACPYDSTVVSGIRTIKLHIKSIILSPNPTTSTLNLAMPLTVTIFSVEIFNLLGRKIISQSAIPKSSSNYSIDMSAYPKGYYFVCIHSSEGIVNRKFVLQ